ncbi:outer membrane protein transport protein [Kordia sp. YSTF-M3]|uniref:Outer membrane protein transport protein n=1 Tax=Kordia aestuariivivens TaxID=2759037 RepID=A0ABR7Q450_9FLAO|nr:outer membrane protein transport protein [Kordia aestuariivivens]MBC8753124.1 outer membrane protein transport protein [Kordia aestuariivivens]
MKKLLLVLTIAFSASVVYAGGYRVGVQGHKQLAMGHTGVAVVTSAESAFFNPAGLVFLDGKLNVSLGAAAVLSNTSYQNREFGYTAEADNPVGTPFYAYGAYKINDWLSAGIAVYTPYGSRVEWPTDWEGSHLVNNIELSAIFVQPTISIKISDKLSVGGGPIYVSGAVNFNRNLSRSLTDENGARSNVTIDASGINAWGYSVGAMFRPTEDINIGVNYRSRIDMDVERGDGTADFENLPAALAPGFADGDFTASLPLPAELTFGIAFTPADKWLVAIDYTRTFWDAYEALDVQFFNSAGLSRNPRAYKNSSIYKIGAQYEATQKVTVRAGFYFDESPIRDGFFAPETPRPDSVNFTAGFTYELNSRWAIDASVLYVHSNEIDNSYDYFTEAGQRLSFGGAYKSNAIVAGIGVSYKL